MNSFAAENSECGFGDWALFSIKVFPYVISHHLSFFIFHFSFIIFH